MNASDQTVTIAPLLFEAENYLARLDLERAAACYAKASELDRDSPLPFIGIARVALASGRKEEGLTLLDSVIKRHPRSVEALTIRGVAAEANGDMQGARTTLELAISIDPSYGLASYNLGRLFAQALQWKEACVHLRRATELLPDEPEMAVMYATAAFRNGAVSESIRVLRRCIATAPYSAGACTTLADVLVESGQFDEADAVLASAELRFSRQAIFPSKRAAIAMRRGDVEGAVVHARQQVKLAPGLDEGWLLISVLEMSRLNLDAAESAIHEVLRRNPKNWRAHYQLGGVYETLKLRELALHAYRNAAMLAPDEWEPKNNLATLLLELDGPSAAREARELLEAAVQTAPEPKRFMPHFNLAIACLKLGDRTTSERHAREALDTVPASHALAPDAKRFMANFA